MPEPPRSRSLVLILAKDLASRLATPVIVVDELGRLVYFNEAAEPVLGTTYAASGFSTGEELAQTFKPQDDDGNPIPLARLPLTIAVVERRAAHAHLSIIAEDGQQRDLEATAFPLLAHKDELVGAMAVFWERNKDDA